MKAAKKRKRASVHAGPWARQTLARMTLEQKLGQLLMLNFLGRFTPTDEPRWLELRSWVAGGKIGGVLLEAKRTPTGIEIARAYPTVVRLNELQRLAKIPLFVAADFETGTAMRLAEGTSLPHAMAVAATDDPHDAYTCGAITALEARAVGVNWVFAPVCDVNSNPENPIINIRSYGENPAKVARFAAEFIRGAQDHGVLATAKHFPGHGDTNVDSHIGLPVISAAKQRVQRVELVPFRAAIAAGVGSVMTGHLLVPAIEPSPALPATLSSNILEVLLRRKMHFDGLIVTDSLDMAGVAMLYPPNRTPVLALEAGADVLLTPPSPEAALTSLREAVRNGRLPIAKIDAAVLRILKAKHRIGLTKRQTIHLARLNETLAKPEFSRTALDIAARGVTLLRDEDHVLPLDATRPLRALLVAISADPELLPGDGLENVIRPRVDALDVRRADTRFTRAEDVDLPSGENYDVAIVAIYVRVADRKGQIGLPPEHVALAKRVLAAGKPAIVACFGSPYMISQFPEARAWIAAFSTTPVAEEAMARAIFGHARVGGKLPVSVPGVVHLGAGLRVDARPMTLGAGSATMAAAFKPAFDLLERAVRNRAFPGGVLGVGHRNQLVVRPFGRLTYEAKSPKVTPRTIYDVASLTKVVVTTTVAMQMVEAKELRLNSPVALYLPRWVEGPQSDWRARVTLADLLRHSSGLPAHRDYYRDAKGYEAVLARVFAEPLEYEPGTGILYSDLDFMLLGEIVRQVTGTPLDDLARTRIFEPLGMNSSFFRPSRRLHAQIAPTENDASWRRKQVRGEVHDQNAFTMGGIAGHAGLFSTAGDLAIFCQMLLNNGLYAHRRLIEPATIRQFTARQTIGNGSYALGWDVPTGKSSSGHFFSPASFGHTGFTGTSIWIDLEKDLFVVLLTNRVFPSAENNRIREVRPALHDAVVRALELVAHS